MQFNTGYNLDGDEISLRTGLACKDKSRTIQSDKQGTDINHIMKVFAKTGQLPASSRVPLDFDVHGIFDFQSAMNTIVDANRNFMALPSNIRARFENDPGKFISFCQNPDNLDEMKKLGLAIPAKPDVSAVPAAGPAPAGNPSPETAK